MTERAPVPTSPDDPGNAQAPAEPDMTLSEDDADDTIDGLGPAGGGLPGGGSGPHSH